MHTFYLKSMIASSILIKNIIYYESIFSKFILFIAIRAKIGIFCLWQVLKAQTHDVEPLVAVIAGDPVLTSSLHAFLADVLIAAILISA